MTSARSLTSATDDSLSAASLRKDSLRVNVADRLAAIAKLQPEVIAVAAPGKGDLVGQNTYHTCTFSELDADATALARGLVSLGVRPGTRIALLVRPGCEFVKLVFALLRCGATTMLIDPGMGRRHLVRCLAQAEPEGFIAISRVQAMRSALRGRFPKALLNVTVGRRWFWGGSSYAQLLYRGHQLKKSVAPALPNTVAGDLAAIIYTSGSTGPPKGVAYTHQMFDTQVAEIEAYYQLNPGGFDLACFALFGLFNSAMGVTTIFPNMDFSRPASADPARLLAAANDWRVTQAFASPAVWNRLSMACEQRGEQIPTLRKAFSCGAPVPANVLRRSLACLPAGAEMHTPYGATESLPVATIEAAEILRETAPQTDAGAGVCVGRKFGTIQWKVIRITDDPIASVDDWDELPSGEIGELVVCGPQVSPEYIGEAPIEGVRSRASRLATHNSFAKIIDEPSTWHRMGDVGYFDQEQRFWYCGRKSHRVETQDGTLFTIPCEAILNTHPWVSRSALVGIGPDGNKMPLAIVEPGIGEEIRAKKLQADLLQLAQDHPHTRPIKKILFHAGLPVDVRHNAKINREQLSKWAARQITT